MNIAIDIPTDRIKKFCRENRIREFAFFGSILRPDFTSESDIDILVSFDSECHYSLLDLARIQQALEEILHRTVDLVEKEALKNPYRRQAILSSMEVLYAA